MFALHVLFFTVFVHLNMQQALDRLLSGRTVIVIAHRLSTVRHADTVFFLADGSVAAQGSHDELVASSVAYASLVRRQLVAAQGLTDVANDAAVHSTAEVACRPENVSIAVRELGSVAPETFPASVMHAP
jgi:ABC-type multidrug transport system ATPase subunit